jgi:hypothetical protein
MSRPDLEMLERDLRAARTAYDDVPVSPDAWQRNQQLVTEVVSESRRTYTAVAAGVVVLLVVAAGWLAFGGRDEASDVPGSGGAGSSDSSSGELTDPVQVARIDLPSGAVRLEVGIEQPDEKAGEPSMCYRLSSASTDGASASGAGGCTSKVDRADLPGVSVDYLTGSNDEVWTTLSGAVDERAKALTVWLTDGSRRDLDLVRFTGRTQRGFGMLLNGPVAMRPQRLVAYVDPQRRDVLEVVDLRDSFGREWLPPGFESDECRQSAETVELHDWLLAVSATPTRASLVDLSPVMSVDHGPWCTPLDRPVQGFQTAGKQFTLVTAPEVSGLSVLGAGQSVRTGEPRWLGSTIWRVQQLSSNVELQPDDEIVATDAAGDEVARVAVRSLVEWGVRTR